MAILKIGIECESIESGQTWGVGRMVNKLLEEIDKRPELLKEFKFILFFKSHIPAYSYLKNPIFEKRIIRTPFNSFSLYYYLFLPVQLWFSGLDAVYFPNYMLPIIFFGRSLVTLTEDVYYEYSAGSLPFRYKLAYRIFGNWSARRATKIMAISESSKKSISRLFNISPDRIYVNYLGIEKPVKSESHNTFGNYFLYVGQAFPRRHLKETMLAFETIHEEFPDFKLIAIGNDKYRPPVINELVRKINNRAGSEIIIHKEYVSEAELISFYANAKAVVYVSTTEAFGLPPIEALAYGVPPIVADTNVTREIFGENAFFVSSPFSSDDIAATMRDTIKNTTKSKKIIGNASDVISRLNWPGHADRFIDIMKNICQKE